MSAKSSSQTGCGNEPSSEEDSGHVRSSPSNYVMQISMGLPPDAQLVQSPPEGASMNENIIYNLKKKNSVKFFCKNSSNEMNQFLGYFFHFRLVGK